MQFKAPVQRPPHTKPNEQIHGLPNGTTIILSRNAPQTLTFRCRPWHQMRVQQCNGYSSVGVQYRRELAS